MKRKLFLAFSVLTVFLWLTTATRAGRNAEPVAPQAGVPTVIGYQGQVMVSGAVYSGIGYFKFAVVDQAGTTTYWSNDGTSTGGSQPTNAVQLSVNNGLFNVLLGDTALANMTALPASAFSGTDRALRVWFSSDGSVFTQLSPDRRIAAVPYALQAEEAKHAATAGDADTVDGQHASAFQQHYQGVRVVAKSGGNYTTITAALDSITDASSTNRYLVKVMPGVYTEQVTMKQYVDTEGSGELTTKITGAGSASWGTGTVVGANNAELRFLTVANTGGNSFATAIRNDSASPRLTHVTASASGGATLSWGVYNNNSSPTMQDVTASASGGTNTNFGVGNYSSSPTMNNVTASASGGTASQGVYNTLSSPTMQNVTASASGGTSNNSGVYNNQSSSLTMQNVTASASGGASSYGVYNILSSPTMQNVTASASGGASSYGVYNESSSPTIQDVTTSASGVTSSYGVYNRDSSATIQNSSLSASGGTSNYGVYFWATSGSHTMRISNSQITASTYTIYNNSNYTLARVGASQLDGGPVGGVGTTTCAGVYDENYTFYASACP